MKVSILSWNTDLNELCLRIIINGYNASGTYIITLDLASIFCKFYLLSSYFLKNIFVDCPYGYSQLQNACYYTGEDHLQQASAKAACQSEQWTSQIGLTKVPSTVVQTLTTGISNR